MGKLFTPVILLLCVDASASATEFYLHYAPRESRYGPFAFAQGAAIKIGPRTFELSEITRSPDADHFTLRRVDVDDADGQGPFELRQRGTIELDGREFLIEVDTTLRDDQKRITGTVIQIQKPPPIPRRPDEEEVGPGGVPASVLDHQALVKREDGSIVGVSSYDNSAFVYGHKVDIIGHYLGVGHVAWIQGQRDGDFVSTYVEDRRHFEPFAPPGASGDSVTERPAGEEIAAGQPAADSSAGRGSADESASGQPQTGDARIVKWVFNRHVHAEGEFVLWKHDRVTLRKADGSTSKLPLDWLREEDQAWIRANAVHHTPREWGVRGRDATSVEGDFVKWQDGLVHIRLIDGTIVAVPDKNLYGSDRKYLKQIADEIRTPQPVEPVERIDSPPVVLGLLVTSFSFMLLMLFRGSRDFVRASRTASLSIDLSHFVIHSNTTTGYVWSTRTTTFSQSTPGGIFRRPESGEETHSIRCNACGKLISFTVPSRGEFSRRQRRSSKAALRWGLPFTAILPMALSWTRLSPFPGWVLGLTIAFGLTGVLLGSLHIGFRQHDLRQLEKDGVHSVGTTYGLE